MSDDDIHYYLHALSGGIIAVIGWMAQRNVNRLDRDIDSKASTESVNLLASTITAKADSKDVSNIKESLTRVETKIDRMIDRMLDGK